MLRVQATMFLRWKESATDFHPFCQGDGDAIRIAAEDAPGLGIEEIYLLGHCYRLRDDGILKPEPLAHFVACKPWLDYPSFAAWVISRTSETELPLEALGLEEGVRRKLKKQELQKYRDEELKRQMKEEWKKRDEEYEKREEESIARSQADFERRLADPLSPYPSFMPNSELYSDPAEVNE